MEVLVGFAFLAGIITVLSPCVIPLLPVLLSATHGGKARPWGIVTGFVVGFSALTLGLAGLVSAWGAPPDLLRWVAIGTIGGFGLVLVVPALKSLFFSATSALTARLANAPRPLVPRSRDGFWSGIVVGLGLGLVWSPCVGPIMASVVTLALSQAVDLGAVLITLAFSLGAAVPMLALLLGGQALTTRWKAFARHSEAFQRVFGGVMLAVAVAWAFGADRAFQTWLLDTFPGYPDGQVDNTPTVNRELLNWTR